MRLGVVAALLIAGCASSPVFPPAPIASAPPVPVQRPAAAPAAQLPAPEPSALRAAMAAALEPRVPDATEVPVEPALIEPVEALVRDGDHSAAESYEKRGRLPPESIQRVVQKNGGKFRDCYQRALLRSASTSGRVVVRFVIGPDGSVARAEEQSASLPDRALRECVLRAFFELDFPNPNEQRIVVEYPLLFARDGKTPLGAIPSARQVAEPPPPGFADAMRAGRRAGPPPPIVPPFVPRTRGVNRSSCAAGDPMCSEL